MLVHKCPVCGKLIPYGVPRCPEHEPQEPRPESVRAYNRKRDRKYLNFYKSKSWRDLSKAKMLQANYRCTDCKGIATEVHHEPPIQTEEGWANRFEWDNLFPLCTRCHNKRHKRF